ncbi:hypothetical protein JXQ31_01335 [candidate division KSB1 bacterium]|nr:hypothetical protein [candidate division KSB1 bacterium]
MEWAQNKNGKVLARELYDHQVDPDENINIADNTEHKALVTELGGILKGGQEW